MSIEHYGRSSSGTFSVFPLKNTFSTVCGALSARILFFDFFVQIPLGRALRNPLMLKKARSQLATHFNSVQCPQMRSWWGRKEWGQYCIRFFNFPSISIEKLEKMY